MLQPYAFKSVIPKRPKLSPKAQLDRLAELIHQADVSELSISPELITQRVTSPLPDIPSTLPDCQYPKVQIQIYHTAWGMNALNHVQAVHFAVTSYLHEYQSLPDGVCVSKHCMSGYIEEVLTFHQGDPYRFPLPIGNRTIYIPIYADSRYGLLVPNRIQCFQYINNPQ